MANETIHDQVEATSADAADELALWVTASSLLNKITKANFMGGSMTGGGVLATGGFTLTVPATGTASLLGTAQTYTAAKTFSAGAITDTVKAASAAGLSLQDDGGSEAAKVLDGGILAIPSVLRTTVTTSIADDAAYSFSIYGEWGFLLLVTPAMPETSCLISFRVSASVSACTMVAQPATTVVATTGVLTGTSGSDNKLTVSAHTDRKIYIENRTGTARTLRWLVIDMA